MQTLEDSGRQGGLLCYSPCGQKKVEHNLVTTNRCEKNMNEGYCYINCGLFI